ncbi:hypothetical protein GCM10010441_10250 [Kitasatospora paracochleata]
MSLHLFGSVVSFRRYRGFGLADQRRRRPAVAPGLGPGCGAAELERDVGESGEARRGHPGRAVHHSVIVHRDHRRSGAAADCRRMRDRGTRWVGFAG